MANHSDFAMMHVAYDFLVAEHPRDIPDSFGDGTLLLEPELCSPGFGRLCDFYVTFQEIHMTYIPAIMVHFIWIE